MPDEPTPVTIHGSAIRVTRLDATGEPIGPTKDLSLKRMTMEVTMQSVDPDLLALLTGSYADGSKPVRQSMWVHGETPWKWWQWQRWLRRPKRAYSYYLPNVESKIEPLN